MQRWHPKGEVVVPSSHVLNPCILGSNAIGWSDFSMGWSKLLWYMSNNHVAYWMTSNSLLRKVGKDPILEL